MDQPSRVYALLKCDKDIQNICTFKLKSNAFGLYINFVLFKQALSEQNELKRKLCCAVPDPPVYLPPSMKAQCKLPEWNKKTPSDQSPAVYPIHQLMESPVIMHVTPQICIIWNEHYQGFHHWFQPHPVILEHYHCHIQFFCTELPAKSPEF